MELKSKGEHRYIESDQLPHDAQVVDHTWQFVNKDGGPDRRFSSNYQIPVCLYGYIELATRGGFHWFLETSVSDAPGRIAGKLLNGAATLAAANMKIVPTGSEYYGQTFGELLNQLASIAADYAQGSWKGIAEFSARLPGRYDRLLRTIAGQGNNIILWFLRFLFPSLAFALLLALTLKLLWL